MKKHVLEMGPVFVVFILATNVVGAKDKPMWAGPGTIDILPEEQGNAESSELKQARRNREWLTAYLLSQGRGNPRDVESLSNTFSTMSPSQLRVLVQVYKNEQQTRMAQGKVVARAQQQLSAEILTQARRQQELLDRSWLQGQSRASDLEQQRLGQIRVEAGKNRQRWLAQRYWDRRTSVGPVWFLSRLTPVGGGFLAYPIN